MIRLLPAVTSLVLYLPHTLSLSLRCVVPALRIGSAIQANQPYLHVKPVGMLFVRLLRAHVPVGIFQLTYQLDFVVFGRLFTCQPRFLSATVTPSCCFKAFQSQAHDQKHPLIIPCITFLPLFIMAMGVITNIQIPICYDTIQMGRPPDPSQQIQLALFSSMG